MLQKFVLPLSIVIAGVMIAGALFYTKNAPAETTIPQVSYASATTAIRAISDNDHILGNPEASIIIVEYSDTECPYCKQFHTSLRRLMDEYGGTGKVAWVYRHFPIESLHSKAPKEAEALECANELGGPSKFWQYTNLVYDTTDSNDSLDPAQLPKIAKSIGIDVASFNDCLSGGKFKNKVQVDYDDVIKAGGRGTPTSFIVEKDGTQTMLPGALPYASLKATIDAFLKSN